MGFLLVLLIGFGAGSQILFGQTKALRITGICFIIYGVIGAIALLSTVPERAESSLLEASSEIQDIRNKVSIAEAHIDGIEQTLETGRETSYDELRGMVDARKKEAERTEEFAKLWDSSVPYIGHDFLDNQFGLSLLEIILGFICLRLAGLVAQQSKKIA
jgi:hypothetical protein